MKNVKLFLVSIGPGLFLVGYNIGTGSVTTMASAGASYGLSLLWPVFISCLFSYVLIITFGQYTLITGKTALQSFKQNFGNLTAKVILWSLILSEMVSSIGVMAIVVQVIHEYSKYFSSSAEGLNSVLITLLVAGLVVGLLFKSKYSFIEQILLVFVSLMGVGFLLSAVLIFTDQQVNYSQIIPRIPDDTNAGLIIAGMIGTTMGGVLYMIRSSTVKQKAWSIKDLRLERRDAAVSATLMFLLSAAIMAAAAGTMYSKGLKVENAIDMVNLLEPIAGTFAMSFFVIGIIAAGVSSLFPHYLLVPILLADLNEKELDLTTTKNRAIIIFYAILGLVVPIFGGRPVEVMILSQTLALMATPTILILMWIQINRKQDMGAHVATQLKNGMMGLMTVFTLAMCLMGLRDIIGSI